MIQSSQPPAGDSPTGIVSAFVLAKSPRLDSLPEIVATLRRRFPELGEVGEVESKSATDSEWVTHFLQLEGNRLILVGIPTAVPWGDLEGPCQTAWWWPAATDSLRNHGHHFLCTLVGEQGSIVHRHVVLTHLVAALTEHADAVGVYWGNGTLVHEPGAFRAASEGLTASDLRPHLWIDVRMLQNDDTTCDMITTGMQAFGLMEFECERCPWPLQELWEFALDLTDYVIQRGESLGDQETVGRSGDEKITIRHRPSRWPRGDVMRLEFP